MLLRQFHRVSFRLSLHEGTLGERYNIFVLLGERVPALQLSLSGYCPCASRPTAEQAASALAVSRAAALIALVTFFVLDLRRRERVNLR